MKDRIKAIRKAAGISQTEFGRAVKVSLSAVQKWESGENTPSDALISLICHVYNVNESWLRTGEGDMLLPRSQEDEISSFLGSLCGGRGSGFQRRLVSVLARLSPAEWDILEAKVQELLEEDDPVD